MRKMNDVRVIDKGWNRIQREIKRMDNGYAKVGVISGGGEHGYRTHSSVPPTRNTDRAGSEMDIAKLALLHQFGSPARKIPARPFMSIAFDGHVNELHRFIKSLKGKIFKGELDTGKALRLLGEKHVDHVKTTIGSSKLKGNKPSTKAKKGSSAPLIDTGRLRQSVTYEVHE